VQALSVSAVRIIVRASCALDKCGVYTSLCVWCSHSVCDSR